VTEAYCWAITQLVGSHFAADHFPVWSSLDFNWTL